MIGDVREVQSELENRYMDMQPAIDKAATELYNKDPKEAVKFLTWYSTTTADESVDRWKKLGEFLIVSYNDGAVKRVKNGKIVRPETGNSAPLDRPGYPQEFLKEIVKATGDRYLVK